jgi:hypothetical protein
LLRSHQENGGFLEISCGNDRLMIKNKTEECKMGIQEIIFIGIVGLSLGGCLVYSIIENNKKK